MDRRGVVVDVKNNSVFVLLQRHEACGSCKGCSLGRENGKETLVEARNSALAKKGDFVELNIASSKIAKAAMIAYGVPLILIIIVLTIGYYFQVDEGMIFLSLGLALILSYLINKKFLEPRRQKANNYEVEAKRIVNSLEEDCDE